MSVFFIYSSCTHTWSRPADVGVIRYRHSVHKSAATDLCGEPLANRCRPASSTVRLVSAESRMQFSGLAARILPLPASQPGFPPRPWESALYQIYRPQPGSAARLKLLKSIEC